MSSGLQRRRVAGGGNEGVSSPVTPRPDTLSAQNPFSGRSSPAILSPTTNDGINAIDSSSSDHRIAFDPRDMEEGEERLKFPKLTLMEEVLLLGLKDKQVSQTFCTPLLVFCLCYFVVWGTDGGQGVPVILE
jgi:golgi phosphoprotein 3